MKRVMYKVVSNRLIIVLFLVVTLCGGVDLEQHYQDFSFSGKFLIKKKSQMPLITFRDGNIAEQKYKILITSDKIIFRGSLFSQEKNYQISINQQVTFKVIADGVQLQIFIDGEKFFQLYDGVSRRGKITLAPASFASFSNLQLSEIDNGMKTVGLSPKQALKSFVLRDNLKLKLIADEKLIQNPVMVKFDFKGRLWVVEMSGYMRKNEKGVFDIPGGHIALLTDTNKDGVYDKRVTFLENVAMPRSVQYIDGGILYADQDNLYFVRENNGKKGDIEVVDAEYTGANNPEKDSNGLLRAIDNWIYSANSSYRYRRVNNKWLKEKSFKRGQWGISQDNYGRLFYTANSTPFIGDKLLPNFFISSNNNFLEFANSFYSKKGKLKRVFPIVNNYVNRGYLKGVLDSHGRLQSATSISAGTVYGGTNLGDKYQQVFMSTEPAGNLIKAITFRDTNKGFEVNDLFHNNDLLQSYDRLFRPVDIRTSPNGSLVVVDFYRGIIQHNIYLTDYLKKLSLDNSLDNVMDLGRVYQIYNPSRPLDKVEDLTQKTTAQLIKLLNHHNRWWRQNCQNLIVDRQQKTTKIKQQLVKQFFTSEKNEYGRIHTLWTLEGLGILDENQVLKFFKSNNLTQWVKNHLFHSLRNQSRLNSNKLLQVIEESLNSDGLFNKVYALQLLSKFYSQKAKNIFIKTAKSLQKNKSLLAILFLNLTPQELQTKYSLNWDTFFPKKKVKVLNISQREKVHFNAGKKIFSQQCHFCHGRYGQGIVGIAPPLINSEWVKGSKDKLIGIILKGLVGKITVRGKSYSGVMPNFEKNYTDAQLADLLSFLRSSFDNSSSFVSEDDVAKVRKQLQGQKESFTQESIEKFLEK